MSNVEWDSKTVIGNKAKAPKVTRNAADLNGMFHREINIYVPLITNCLFLSFFTAVRVLLYYYLLLVSISPWSLGPSSRCGRRN